MSVLIVGSTALDSIKTPDAVNPRLLGGSASYASVAASFFAPVKMVGVVGEDFPKPYLQLYRKHKIDLEGLQIVAGKTFHWAGEYEVNMNNRRTLETELGVFESFTPHLPKAYQDSQFVLLANIAPSLQHHVLEQMRRPKFVVADTMDLWLNIALPDLLKLLRRVDGFVLNESEAQQLTQEHNLIRAAKKIHRLGPKYVIVKKGEHGAILSTRENLFVAPAFPLDRVVDPTGAGDCFVGGMMGYLSTAKGSIDANLRKAMVYGSVVASFCCEGFGLKSLTRTTRVAIDRRMKILETLIRF
ncbi:MAG TPA: PfkB family carbohydrate kinase [Candidatus Saccharimonadales bacterium]|nr:PfkB family carbohydrate kinase [Candidatus Saccharimonadales bacterium]